MHMHIQAAGLTCRWSAGGPPTPIPNPVLGPFAGEMLALRKLTPLVNKVPWCALYAPTRSQED